MKVDDSIRKAASLNLSVTLKAMAAVSQVRVAELLGESTTTVSDFKRDHLERLAAMLAACGLRVGPVTEEGVSNDELWALRVLASKQLERKGPDSGFGSM